MTERIDLPKILDVVAQYLDPDALISYGKMVELLREIPGVGHWTIGEIYPRLFNAVAEARPVDVLAPGGTP